MSFLLKIPRKTFNEIIIYNSFKKFQENPNKYFSLFFDNNPGGHFVRIKYCNEEYFFIGDFIIPKENKDNSKEYLYNYCKDFNIKKLRESKGNFYIIHINIEKKLAIVYNSMMSILPVYYYDSGDAYYISSRMDSILQTCTNTFSINKKYILEFMLLGYSFQDCTLFQGIKLLPTNNYLSVQRDSLTIQKHTDLSDFYVQNPETWRTKRDDLSDLFLERASDYLPDEPYYSSFTGGLDGRTLLALGLSKNKNITAYSYGAENDKDVIIPQNISNKIGLSYEPFLLDEKYAKDHYLNYAKQAGYLTEGNIRFTRATYLYLSEKLSGKTNYLISGNFGSELMRTMRMHGNLLSHIIFDLFSNIEKKEFRDKVINSPRLKYLNLDFFKKELELLVEECFTYKENLKDNLSLNQKFYTFLLEEVFRKYFGAEIVLENFYLINRTPFLDFPFITELFKTELAGCNGEYKVNNPFERFKGQVLYPYIIKKTYPKLLKYKLDREYKPGDFLSFYGHLRIAFGYFLRKYFIDKKRYEQPEYSKLSFERNMHQIQKFNAEFDFIDKNNFSTFFSNTGWKNDLINFNIHLTFIDYFNHVLNRYHNVKYN